jgi:transcriptional regulator with XRE-family HTH domain
MTGRGQSIGDELRRWRKRRDMSQLDLALSADISTRHLSFVETGRSQPGRELLLRLTRELEIPLRGRNELLVSAGFAPVFQQRSYDDPAFDPVRRVIDAALALHRPFPAYVIDRYWDVVASNGAVPELFEGIAPELARRPMNVVRLMLHPRGLAPRAVNLGAWRTRLLARLRQQVNLTADPALEALLREARSFPGPDAGEEETTDPDSNLMVPLQIMTGIGRLSFLNATMVFGTPVDVTLEEIALEKLYPADASTEDAIRRAAARHLMDVQTSPASVS